MPGARITEKVDDTHYKGTVAVKLGPASLSFRGQIEVLERDAATRTLKLSAKGTDTTGASFATMDLTARVEDESDGTSALVGSSEATVGGKAAAFGGRMMDAVSEQILKQFGANFTAKVVAFADSNASSSAAGEPTDREATNRDATNAASAPAASSTGAATGDAGTIAADAARNAARDTGSPTSAGRAAAAVTAHAAPPADAPQLNGLALLWAVFVDWLRGLFRKKNAR
jgi:carbon monoxide dehydrogenase subunit G